MVTNFFEKTEPDFQECRYRKENECRHFNGENIISK